MTVTTVLRGSLVDRKPLAPCARCGHLKEQSGGLWWNGRFCCRDCVLVKTKG